jgi:hypothetical protein
VSKHNRIPGGLSRVCCGARARRRVRVARWRRVVGGCRRVPVPPVESVPGPWRVFGWRAVPFYVVVTVALIAQLVWWFVSVPLAPVAPGFGPRRGSGRVAAACRPVSLSPGGVS